MGCKTICLNCGKAVWSRHGRKYCGRMCYQNYRTKLKIIERGKKRNGKEEINRIEWFKYRFKDSYSGFFSSTFVSSVMIEDKELGLKVAESEDEAFWEEVKQNSLKDIDNLNKLLKFQTAIVEMANSKLIEMQTIMH